MKKIKKTIATAYRLRKLIDWYMDYFNLEYELWEDVEHELRCVPDDEEEAVRSKFHNVMVTFYDENHNRLVSNWLGNSNWLPPFYNWQNEEFRIGITNHRVHNDIWSIEAWYHLDLRHLTWNQIELLSKARYITIGTRSSESDRIFEENENGKYYSYLIETGYEANIHCPGKAPVPYERKVEYYEYSSEPAGYRRPPRKTNAEEETA